MDIYKTQAQLFKALMHPTRLAILEELREGEQCVCHMEAVFGLRQAYISQHLMVLRDAGLVTDRRDGWNIYYQVSKPEIFQVIDAMNIITNKTDQEHLENQKYMTRSSSKQRPCPCPKCNSGAETNRQEAHSLATDKVEISI